ncbi:hypothetical protein Gohar_021298, partial [Gossypium harknessii]|nr:hypothetical protein [Gossypium harknessii]
MNINFDASFQSHSSHSYSGIIIQNEEGLVLGASLQMHSNVPNALIAKALAFGDSLTIVKKANSLHDDRLDIASCSPSYYHGCCQSLNQLWVEDVPLSVETNIDSSPLALTHNKTFPMKESLA